MKNVFEKDDAALIKACINRDLVAWSFFVKKYEKLISIAITKRLKRYSMRLDSHDIDDIRQNILTSIWQDNKLTAIQDPKALPYWLAMVAGNEAIVYIRRRRSKEPIIPVSLSQKIDERDLADMIPDRRTPSDDLARSELLKRIEDEIAKLPDKKNLVIKLSLFYGKKHHEIAGMLGIPAGTVSNYIKRAKETLAVALKDFS